MTTNLQRFLGGSPLGVILKLVALSLIVGAIMVGIGLTPRTIVAQFVNAIRTVYDLGYDAFSDAGLFLLTGAVVVVPIWLLTRLMQARR